MISLTIPGRVPTYKNAKQNIRLKTGRIISLPSKRVTAWKASARPHIEAFRDLRNKSLLHAEMHFYFKNHQAEVDLDNCIGGPLDLMQEMNVIKNDKQIISIYAKKHFGDSNERTEITLTEIKDGEAKTCA